MAYHAWPQTYPSNVRYDGPTYINDFKDKVRGTDIKVETERKKVANFVRVIGDLLGNRWGIEGTSSHINSTPMCFERMGYPKFGYAVPYNIHSIKESLIKKRPVLIDGDYEPYKGHEWIIDGCILKQIGYDYFYFDGNARFVKYRFKGWINESEKYYLHCNYGWGGKENGYYLDQLFVTKNYDFSYDASSLLIIPNIHK